MKKLCLLMLFLSLNSYSQNCDYSIFGSCIKENLIKGSPQTVFGLNEDAINEVKEKKQINISIETENLNHIDVTALDDHQFDPQLLKNIYSQEPQFRGGGISITTSTFQSNGVGYVLNKNSTFRVFNPNPFGKVAYVEFFAFNPGSKFYIVGTINFSRGVNVFEPNQSDKFYIFGGYFEISFNENSF